MKRRDLTGMRFGSVVALETLYGHNGCNGIKLIETPYKMADNEIKGLITNIIYA